MRGFINIFYYITFVVVGLIFAVHESAVFVDNTFNYGAGLYGMNGVLIPIPSSPDIVLKVEYHTNAGDAGGTEYTGRSEPVTLPDGTTGYWDLQLSLSQSLTVIGQEGDTVWYLFPFYIEDPSVTPRVQESYVGLFSRTGTHQAIYHSAIHLGDNAYIKLLETSGSPIAVTTTDGRLVTTYSELVGQWPFKEWTLAYKREGDQLIEISRKHEVNTDN